MTRSKIASEKTLLWQHCRKFIDEQHIHCAETIYQTDTVIEKAYDFIHGVCEIVGYHKPEDED